MKLIQKTLLLAITLFCFSFTMNSCNTCTAADVTRLSADLSTAAQVYSADPSTENCEAYKAALELYLDEIEGCDGVTQETIDANRQVLDGLNC